MSRPDDYLDPIVDMLVDSSDEAFIGALLQVVATPDDDSQEDRFAAHTRLLFRQEILSRLARIRHEEPGLFLGRFTPELRKRRRDLFLPDLIAALDNQKRDYDPFAFADGSALLQQPVRPVQWLVHSLIADGLTILGGTPKSGKSYLAYALAIATAVYGEWVQHWTVERGSVLFISLEDDADDTRLRLAELDASLSLPAGAIRFVHGLDAVPSFEGGLIPWLTEAIEQYHPRLIVIDPISYLYSPPKRGNGDQFAETRSMLFPLRWLGKANHCAIVALDHRRKRSRDDVSIFDTLHGSIAKQAVADALLMVERDDEQITMSALVRRGKDATHTLSMLFRDGGCFLTYTGEATPQGKYGDFRQQVYTTLMQYRIPMTVKEIMADLELPQNRQIYDHIHKVCLRGVKAKELEKTGRGAFVWATQVYEGRE